MRVKGGVTPPYCDVPPIEINNKIEHTGLYIFSFQKLLSKSLTQWIRTLTLNL